MEKTQPTKKFVAGSIRATIWTNKTDDSEFNTISLERAYKDKDGNWKTTNVFRLNDLPKAALVLNKSYEYLMLKKEEN